MPFVLNTNLFAFGRIGNLQRLHERGSILRVLVMAGAQDTILKARLSPSPVHPRAMASLIEAIALWQGFTWLPPGPRLPGRRTRRDRQGCRPGSGACLAGE